MSAKTRGSADCAGCAAPMVYDGDDIPHTRGEPADLEDAFAAVLDEAHPVVNVCPRGLCDGSGRRVVCVEPMAGLAGYDTEACPCGAAGTERPSWGIPQFQPGSLSGPTVALPDGFFDHGPELPIATMKTGPVEPCPCCDGETCPLCRGEVGPEYAPTPAEAAREALGVAWAEYDRKLRIAERSGIIRPDGWEAMVALCDALTLGPRPTKTPDQAAREAARR